MKRNSLRAVGILLAFLISIPVAAQPGPDTVVLTINEKPVYFWEIGVVIPQVQTEFAGRGMQGDREAVIQAAMKRVVNIRLLGQEARKRGMKADGTRVDATIAQLETQAGGREAFVAALDQIGVTYDQFKANISEADLVKVFISKTIDPKVTVTAEEVQAYYEDNPEMFARPDMVRALHILVRISREADELEKEAAKVRATEAHQRVVSGEDFAGVAREVSDGPNAAQGGDLGFFASESMVPALSTAAFALDVGEISDVIESQFGFHILELKERRPASTMPFSEAKEPLEEMLRGNKTGEKVSQLLVELTGAATIVEVPPPADLAASEGGG